MFKLFKIACLFALLMACSNAAALPKTTSSIAIDMQSGEIIASENSNAVRHPASLTKLMTLYLTFEALEKGTLKLNTPLKISRYAANRSPSRVGVKPGQTISVEDAIKAVIVKSANDCATVLAEALAKDEREFAKLMNNKAKKLGMKKTVFRNASGLNHSAQVSTAHDMAILGRAVYTHFPQYYKWFSLKKFTYKGKTFYTHNHVLKNFKGADGMKTGYLASAGYNIVTSAERNGIRILAVTMGHKSIKERDKKVMAMMDKGIKKIALNQKNAPKTVMAKLEIPERVSHQALNKKIISKPDVTGEWGIQIGAFRNYAKARSYAFTIKQEIPEIQDYPVDVEVVTDNMAVLYRSKITNFSKKDAEELCHRLKKENKSCIVVNIKNDTTLTLAKK